MDEGSERVFEGQGEPLRLEDQHFLDCLGHGAAPLSDGRSGVEVVRVLEQADAQLRQFLTATAKETA